MKGGPRGARRGKSRAGGAVAAAAIAVLALLAGWLAAGGNGGDGPPRTAGREARSGQPAGAQAQPAPGAEARAQNDAGEPPVGAGGGDGSDGLRRVPIPAVDTRTPAWLALAQARESGDSRMPPIQRDAPAERPDASVLADQEAYASYQLAQKQRLAAAYAQAAGPELARLQADLEQGREAGIAPDELARVAEKIRRIEQQRQAAEAMLSKSKER